MEEIMNAEYIKKYLLYKPEHVVKLHFDKWQASLEAVPSEGLPKQPAGYYQALVSYVENPDKMTYEEFLEGWPERRKLNGILYEEDGKEYHLSATKEDMWGLMSVLLALQSHPDFTTDFYFDNGTVLNIGIHNVAGVQAAWLPFRHSFFNDGSDYIGVEKEVVIS